MRSTSRKQDIIGSFGNYALMYIFLFICLTTSGGWGVNEDLSRGEIFRFDKMLLFGQVNIYYLFSVVHIIVLAFEMVSNKYKNNVSDRNYLKYIWIAYFIPGNLLVYLAVYLKDIELIDLGLQPVAVFFVYLVATYYVQDIFIRNKDREKLSNILTTLEILIIVRCCYSIGKYFVGFGDSNPVRGGVRLGTEDDFADFFILLFIIALSSLLFNKNAGVKTKMVHVLGIITSSYVAIYSFRRYFWGELIVAIGIILLSYYRFGNVNVYKKVMLVFGSVVVIFSSMSFVGADRITNNYYVGRLLTSISLLDYRYESEYGIDTGHRAEIQDGWYNVKKNWLLGITPFGADRMERFETAEWQSGLFIHNGYLQVWVVYGLLGFILYVLLYLKSVQLGYIMFIRYKSNMGLILLTFMACQMIKNIVWPTAITNMNVTIIYIFLISLVLKARRLETAKNG